jgi:hypothetical protein
VKNPEDFDGIAAQPVWHDERGSADDKLTRMSVPAWPATFRKTDEACDGRKNVIQLTISRRWVVPRNICS